MSRRVRPRPPARRLRGPHRPRWSRTWAAAPLPCSPPPTGSTRAGARRASSSRRSRAGATAARRVPHPDPPARPLPGRAARGRGHRPVRPRPPQSSRAQARPSSSCARACTTSWRRSRSGSRISAEHEAIAARAVVSDLGDEFVTLRDYEVGDDLRRVHWRSTARTGELMIRQDEARWRSRAAVVLDVHPGGARRGVVRGRGRGRGVGRRAPGAAAAAGRGDHQRGRGARHRRRPAPRRDRPRSPPSAPTSATAWPTVLENLRAHRRVDLVVAVLGRVAPDTLRALGALRRHRRRSSCSPSPRSSLPHASRGRGRRVGHAVRRPPGTRPGPSPRRVGSPRRESTAHVMARARPLRRAVRARGAERRSPRCRSGASSTPAASCCPVLGAALLPHALGALGAVARLAGVGRRARSPSSALAVYVRARARAVDHHARPPERRHVARARRASSPAGGTCSAPRRAGARPPTAPSSSRCSRCGAWPRRRLARVRRAQPRSPRSSPALVFFVWTSTLGTDDWQRRCSPSGSASPPARSSSPRTSPCSTSAAAGWCRSKRRAPHWLAPGRAARRRRDRGRARRRAAASRAPASDPLLDVADAGPRRRRRAQLPPSLAPFVDIGAKLGDVDDRELFTVQSPHARLLAHRRARPVHGRRRRSVDAQRRGRRQRARSACRATSPADARAGLRDRPAGRTVAARGVPTRRDQPRRHAGGARPRARIVADADDVERPALHRSCPTLPAAAGTESPTRSSSRPRRAACPPPSRRVHRSSPGRPRSTRSSQRASRSSTTPGATTPYAKAEALRDYFRDRSTGSSTTPTVDSFDNAIGHPRSSSTTSAASACSSRARTR